MRYHTGSPRNTRKIQIQRKPTTSLCLLLFSSALSLPSSWLALRLAFSSPFCSSGDMDTIISRYIVSCDIAWYGLWYHDIPRYIMRYHTGSPRHTRQAQIQRKPTTSLWSALVFFGFVSALILACPPSGLSSSFCCSSAGHIIGCLLYTSPSPRD